MSKQPRIELGRWAVIRTAASLRRIIDSAIISGDAEKQPGLTNQLKGIYSTRMFGLVFYRNADYKINLEPTII